MQDVTPAAEPFRSLPNPSEIFGTIPKDSESFRNVPNHSERKDNHTLTVREVARMFEGAGVARTERSITNWCQPNKLGILRLDSYFDPNERRYFISRQSVDLAIKEEQAKATKTGELTEPIGPVPQGSEISSHRHDADVNTGQVKEFQKEIMDLKITNRAKDMFIERLQKERDDFSAERRDYVDKLMTFNRQIGELESKVLRIEAPQMPQLEQDTQMSGR